MATAAIRRLVDMSAALVGLAVFGPVLIAAAIAVRLDSPGKALYGGPRVGRGGRGFLMWKFRTMQVGAAEAGPPITAPGDSRITRVGRVLRRTKIDELPQLLNVLKGDMSLVGPRPEAPEIVDLYTPEQRRTLLVRPGITGPGTLFYEREQVHTIPDDVPADEFYVTHLLGPKLEKELEYLDGRTLGSDLRILGETAGHVLGSLRRRR